MSDLPDEVRTQILEVCDELDRNFSGEVMDGETPESYAVRWWQEEGERLFFLGCCDFKTRKPVIYAVEAVRQLNRGRRGDENGQKLLRMALEELSRALKD